MQRAGQVDCMNHSQSTLLRVTALLVFIQLLYPPFRSSTEVARSLGILGTSVETYYDWIWSGGFDLLEGQLLMQFLATLIVASLLYISLRRKD